MVEAGQREFRRVISDFIEKMGFDVDSVREVSDTTSDFVAKTVNPAGEEILSLIRASTFIRLVNERDVEELEKAMKDMGAVRSAYITTSGFNDSAVEAAKDEPISLINKYQLMDSIEKRGLSADEEFMAALDRFGMAEKHFQGVEQSFVTGLDEKEAVRYFESKAGKNEEPVRTVKRYGPVTVLKAVNVKDVESSGESIRSIEKKDYLFINLHNLELYYITRKRKRNTTEYMFRKSEIIRKINDLPEESREHLLDLLEHGDLPVEDLEGKDLSILKNNKVITVYEGKKYTSTTDQIIDGMMGAVNVIVDELTVGITSMGEGAGGSSGVEEKKLSKKVTAEVNMPHKQGGIYDIWKYLETEKGIDFEAEIDPLIHSSKSVAKLVSAVLDAEVTPQGLIFMPYYRSKYVDDNRQVTKYEVLVSPKFKGELETGEKKRAQPRRLSTEKTKRAPVAGDFKLIR